MYGFTKLLSLNIEVRILALLLGALEVEATKFSEITNTFLLSDYVFHTL